MPVSEYTKLCEYSEALEENWGKPPGNLNSAGNDLLIFGKQFGNIFIGVQPTFGYEGDPMRLLFSRSASPHHGFAAYYTFLEKVFKADAVLHFGTHGSLEFMPGKQVRLAAFRVGAGGPWHEWSSVLRCRPPCSSRLWLPTPPTPPNPPPPTHTPKVGMSGVCYPDSLIGSIPNIYYYAANNPSEATIAKRRSYANTISYLTPPAENAGLYKGLKELKELISSYQAMRESGRAEQITATIIETARLCNLDKDVALPPADNCSALTMDERDSVIGNVYRKLMEIESRLLPCGLHVVGVPPTAEEAIATLVNIGGAVAAVGDGSWSWWWQAAGGRHGTNSSRICAHPPSTPNPNPPPPLTNTELDRPDQKPEAIRGLPGILARAIGKNIEEVYAGSNKGVLADVDLLQRITAATRDCVREFVKDRTGEWVYLGVVDVADVCC